MGAAIIAVPQKKFVCVILAAWCTVSANAFYCNGTLLDADKEICCNNETYTIENGSQKLDCCPINGHESELYDVYTKMCCGDQVFDKNYEYACLYNTRYRKQRDLVCPGGKLYQEVDQNFDRCCGNVKFNILKQSCCHDHRDPDNSYLHHRLLQPDESCCGRDIFSTNTSKCKGTKVILLHEDLCRDTPINTRTQVCCIDSGKILNHPQAGDDHLAVYPKWGCCNDNLINKDMSSCTLDDDGHRRIIPYGHEVCGDSHFSTDIRHGVQERCCHGVVRNASASIAVQCCGTKLMQIGVDVCCNNTVINSEKEICCNENILKRTPGRECCNMQKMYNMSTEVCCGARGVHQKTDVSHTDCCGTQSYDNSTQVCKNRELENRPLTSTKKSTRHVICDDKNSPHCQPCPFCGKARLKNFKHIKGKPEYRLRLDAIEANATRKYKLHVKMTIIRPNEMKNRQITVSIRKNCYRCLKKGKIYLLYTNRNVRKRKVLRIERKDVLVKRTSCNLLQIKLQRNGKKQLRKRHQDKIPP